MAGHAGLQRNLAGQHALADRLIAIAGAIDRIVRCDMHVLRVGKDIYPKSLEKSLPGRTRSLGFANGRHIAEFPDCFHPADEVYGSNRYGLFFAILMFPCAGCIQRLFAAGLVLAAIQHPMPPQASIAVAETPS